MSAAKDIRELIKELEKKGWVYKGQNRHHKMIHPKIRTPLAIPVSPSCHHALKNLRNTIKKIEKDIIE